jgi:hypothetical protein
VADLQLCGKWMPRAQTTCVRTPLHGGSCATAEAMARQRQRTAARERPYDPLARHRWRLTRKLKRYGMTKDSFARILAAQKNACAMCFAPFEEGKLVCIDHDHKCCPEEKSSCGKCVRGLLCVSCNTALGIIDARYETARAYLNQARISQVA